MHIPSRDEILPRLVSALKPGGWLLIEEQDIYPVLATASGSYRQVWTTFMQGMVKTGVAPEWGRQLPELLTQQGRQEVGAEGEVSMFCGGSSMADFWSLSWKQVRERILEAGATEKTVVGAEAALNDAAQWFTGPALIAAWGRRSR